MKITSGTKEWADSNVNLYYGCSNNCHYCYAKKIAIRFNRKTNETWPIMVPNWKNIHKNYRKRKGRIMFPTSHDITEDPQVISNCFMVLRKLLQSKNSVLITTKPRLQVIQKLCNEFEEYKELIQFRFTITSINNERLSYWEPNAPQYNERIESLKYAYKHGYKTSLAIEPSIDLFPNTIIRNSDPYVTESIWIGPMNYLSKNIQLFERELIEQNRSQENLKLIYNTWTGKSKIRFKDSFLNRLNK